MPHTATTPVVKPRPEQFGTIGEYQSACAIHAAQAAIGEWHAAKKRATLLTLPGELGYRNHAELIRAIRKSVRRPRTPKIRE